MRVVISGTHGSGKSTLIGDFASSHRDWTFLPDPYEFVDAAEEIPGASVFFAQLRMSAARLHEPVADSTMAERGPLDFLAYLHALDALGRRGGSAGLLERGSLLTTRAMTAVDLLVLLPLNNTDPIEIGADEDPALREAMDMSLLELADDPDLIGTARVVEITGDRAQRLTLLNEAIDGIPRRG